jgi:hypothetical protein
MSDRPSPEESEVIEAIRSIDVHAPATLHERVDELVASRTGRRRPALGARPLLAGATALAVLAAVLTVTLGGGSGSPTPIVDAASALTLGAATAPAPAESQTRSGQLMASVEGVAFPYWEKGFGWRSTGARVDRIDGRPVMTVFYGDGHGRRIGYAIAGGGAAEKLELTSSSIVLRRHGIPYRLLRLHGAGTVVWLRSGHLCVLSGHGVSENTLLRLASWDDGAGATATA